MPSAANFDEQVKITSGFKTMAKPNPKVETTTEFYKTKNKSFKGPVQIGKRKENELESEKWTD